MNSLHKMLEQVINDKTSGSTELLLKLNRIIKAGRLDHDFINEAVILCKKNLSHFAAIRNYLNSVENLSKLVDKKTFYTFLDTTEQQVAGGLPIIFKNAKKYIKDINKILTISNSITLQKFFYIWKETNSNLQITVCESRPNFEGRLFALSLIKKGFKVKLISDAEAVLVVPKIDAVFIGADNILSNGNVVNKTGSKMLALLCNFYGKPFYVIALRNKFINKKTLSLPEGESSEIWNFKHRNLQIMNQYFEIIENKFVTSIISD